MKNILCTTSLTRWNFDALLALAQAAGCDAIELPADPAGRARCPADPFLTDPRCVREKLVAQGVMLAGLFATSDLASLTHVLELAQTLECPMVRVHPPASITGLRALAERFPGVTLLIENSAPLGQARDLWTFLDRVGAANVAASYRPNSAESPWIAVPMLNSHIRWLHWPKTPSPGLRNRLAGIGYTGPVLIDPPISASSDLSAILPALQSQITSTVL